jgi:hypothetical protein
MIVVNWNTAWASPRSRRGRAIRDELKARQPDLVCLTEATVDLLPFSEGSALESEVDYGYGVRDTRRKVILWARQGFKDSTSTSPTGMPSGRYIVGTLGSSPLRVFGVCVPWSMAHVSTGRRDRVRWEDHLQYLSCLGGMLRLPGAVRSCVIGDFNQTVPRLRAPQHVHDALVRALSGLTVLTADLHLQQPLIDHIAVSTGISLVSWSPLPALSDHIGWVAELTGV